MDFDNFDPTAIPAGDYTDDPGAAARERAIAQVRRTVPKLPRWIKADPRRAVRRMTINILHAARTVDPGTFVAFKQAVKKLGVLRDIGRLMSARGKKAAHDGASAYRVTPRGITWERVTIDGTVDTVLLTNFSAEVSSVTIRDDGAETSRFYEVETEFHEEPVEVMVPSGDFDYMRWTHNLPVSAYVLPGQERRAAVAIRELSSDVVERRLFTHTGWRKVDAADVYLHAGGAVGSVGPVAGIRVDLGETSLWRLTSEYQSEAERLSDPGGQVDGGGTPAPAAKICARFRPAPSPARRGQ